ncbi:hypothetical protein YDYSY3_15090 [Paenibacillus chitinolyticus]|nr:hypothetical protein YDYSY3_15090 [Paenibacillus chitinolyticus]
MRRISLGSHALMSEKVIRAVSHIAKHTRWFTDRVGGSRPAKSIPFI